MEYQGIHWFSSAHFRRPHIADPQANTYNADMKRFLLLSALGLGGAWGAPAAGLKLCLEAESALSVEEPMAVASNALAGASGPYLQIPEGAGNPPKRDAGKAVFEVTIPEDGTFTLWCRVWWEGECSNSFTVNVDDQPAFLFGEDATYKAWHWVKYPVSRTAAPIRLAKGRRTLTFKNREDGVHLDQVILSADKRFVPVDIEPPGNRP